MEATIINEQTLMIYFKNEISEDTYNQIIYTTQYIKNKTCKLSTKLFHLIEPSWLLLTNIKLISMS